MTWPSDGCGRLVRALALGVSLSFAGTASAQVELEWSAPPACPARDAVAAQIARLLAGSTTARSAQKVIARATVSMLEGGGYALQLVTEVGGERGARTLQAPSCAELAAASAVIVALLVDPDVVGARPGESGAGTEPSGAVGTGGVPPTTSTPSEAEARRNAAAAEEARARERARDEESDDDDDAGADEDAASADIDISDEVDDAGPRATRVSLRPELVLDIGTLPRPALGPGLALGVHFGALAVELSADYAPRQRVTRGARTLGELTHASATLALCHALPGLPALAPCARAAYGRIWGEGIAVRTPDDGGAALITGEAALRARLPLSRWLALAAEGGLALPLRKPLFTVGGVGVIHEPAPLLVRLRAGLEARL